MVNAPSGGRAADDVHGADVGIGLDRRNVPPDLVQKELAADLEIVVGGVLDVTGRNVVVAEDSKGVVRHVGSLCVERGWW